jgi:2-C-methyl-D-erythritol 2,4-cyclodiphosphate synthase
MRSVISEILETLPENISIKATTTEKLGFTGREEGAVAIAVALLGK